MFSKGASVGEIKPQIILISFYFHMFPSLELTWIDSYKAQTESV